MRSLSLSRTVIEVSWCRRLDICDRIAFVDAARRAGASVFALALLLVAAVAVAVAAALFIAFRLLAFLLFALSALLAPVLELRLELGEELDRALDRLQRRFRLARARPQRLVATSRRVNTTGASEFASLHSQRFTADELGDALVRNQNLAIGTCAQR